MVDGTVEAGQAHGRPVSIQLCRAAQRGLPTMEHWWWDDIAAEQCTGAGKANTAEGQEHF